ncbi:MAG TPA: CBS domain-containing protein, partial [Candidatus Korarchaeota archaeon]|nr:CBS domain-containing protein [Candidatus Korarchaeota archaeon]
SMHDALLKMLRCDVGRLPVVEDGRIVGILTRTDVVKAYERAVLMKDLEEAARM